MIIIIILTGALTIIVLSAELAHIIAYGFPLKDTVIEMVYSSDLVLNTFNDEILSKENGIGEFFSISAKNLFTKWYINDIGTIPRWSIYSKLLDQKRLELIAKNYGIIT